MHIKKIVLIACLAFAPQAKLQAAGELVWLLNYAALGVVEEKLIHHTSTPVALVGTACAGAFSRFVFYPLFKASYKDQEISKFCAHFGFVATTAAGLLAYYLEKDKSPKQDAANKKVSSI